MRALKRSVEYYFWKEFNNLSDPSASGLFNPMRHLKSQLQIVHAIKTIEEYTVG